MSPLPPCLPPCSYMQSETIQSSLAYLESHGTSVSFTRRSRSVFGHTVFWHLEYSYPRWISGFSNLSWGVTSCRQNLTEVLETSWYPMLKSMTSKRPRRCMLLWNADEVLPTALHRISAHTYEPCSSVPVRCSTLKPDEAAFITAVKPMRNSTLYRQSCAKWILCECLSLPQVYEYRKNV
jgi:hypothetical protein